MSPAPCRDALDVNDDSMIDVTDPIGLLSYMFLGHAEPKPPFPRPGLDPTPDDLPEC